MVKKILCLFLVLSFMLFFVACTNVSCFDNSIACDSLLNVDLKSSMDLLAELDDEGIDVENSEEYDVLLLIEAKDNRPIDLYIENIIIEDDVDEALLKHRKKVKDYYLSYNQAVVENLGFFEYDYYISFYSPYIEIVFDDANEYVNCEGDIFDSLQSNQNLISSASNCVVYKDFEEASFNDSEYSTLYTLNQAFDDIGVLNTQYTGQGIKVGVIESGIPQNTVNLKEGHYTFLHTNSNKHAWVVSSIIGGTTGIAEDVCFYFASSTGFVDKSNMLIDTYGVNIINMSFGFLAYGNYTNADACLDTIISNTGCTIVKSAGNRSDDASDPYYITAPGCSMNAITVGSIDYNENLSIFSSWLSSEAFLIKPDVVAPGGRLYNIPNIPSDKDKYENDIGHSGTSYAAPMVVGTIALLMEEFPTLKTNPALVKSVLHLGAEELPSQTSYFDQQAGFGLINYQNMRNCLLNANYSNFEILTTASAGNIVLSQYVTIPYLDGICVNANSIIYSSCEMETATGTIPTYTDYSIKIFDLGTSAYVATSTIDSNVDYLIFTNNNENNSSFRIDIVLEEDSASDETEAGAIAYEIICNNHTYGRYFYRDNHTHIKYCSCGAYITEGHYIRESSIVDNRYALCLGCRAQLDLFEDFANSIMSTNTQVSINGSYILPSGIVVLVDEDIQAYLDGTLVFYHPDNVPTTQ